jgi:hypothetical protein
LFEGHCYSGLPLSLPQSFQISTSVNNISGKFAAGVNDSGVKIAAGIAGINNTAANLPLVSMTPVANFSTSFASVVNTGGKFATGVNDTGGKFATSANNTSIKIAAAINNRAANLLLVSTTPVANYSTSFASVVDTGG